MLQAFERLERVLLLEKEQGYQNKAVVGGIGQFAGYWVEQARKEMAAGADEGDKALVEQTAEVLAGYGKLPGTEARASMVDNLLSRLPSRQARPTGPPAAPPSAPVQRNKPPLPQAGVSTAKVVEEAPELRDEPAPPADEPRTVEEPADEPDYSALPGDQPPPDPRGLMQPVTILPEVGQATAQRLETLGATTVGELLRIYPRRYDDFSLMKPINRLQYGEQVTVIGTVWQARARRIRGNQTVLQAIIADGSGRIEATWFNQPWLADKLSAGMQIVLRGKVDKYLGRLVFNSPEWEPLSSDLLRSGRIIPVYPLTKGLASKKMRDVMQTAVSQWATRVPDPLPESSRRRRRLLPLPQAMRQVHFPDSQEALHAARRRLAFDELLLLQLGMLGQRREWRSNPGLPLPPDSPLLSQFVEGLPFQLTGAQQRVIGEIAADVNSETPMNRLLQGDVGAGKTVVAAAAMLLAVAGGTQAVLMAPTEILAEQHYAGLSRMLAGLDLEPALLTGSTPAAQKEQIYRELAGGNIQLIIGTHALIQQPVQFKHLGLVVIDEQHRFGVDQRQALRDKGARAGSNGHPAGQLNPHLLVMSATPIPRTLALSMYGDLDISVLDEMPPGRQEIKTDWIRPGERERTYSFVRGQIQQGRQAFIICPLVEESDKIDEKAAVEEHARLQEQVFPDLKLGLLHGRMNGEEKEQVMRAFVRGETNILVSTSVIEVGVDVPNSTVMLIEGANRFGLAQLHQFRGRVGRGVHQSYCLLVADSTSQEAEERLRALEKTNDGFLLAEKDLELRGPGEFFGRRQSGLPELRLASLLDVRLLEEAREEAQVLFQNDALLEQPEHQLLREQVAHFWETAGDIS